MYGVSDDWSTQNPYANPESFGQLEELANAVRATAPNPDGSRKVWWAPFTPGMRHPVRRQNLHPSQGRRHDAHFKGNDATDPDGWTLISWNETRRAPMSIRCNGTATAT